MALEAIPASPLVIRQPALPLGILIELLDGPAGVGDRDQPLDGNRVRLASPAPERAGMVVEPLGLRGEEPRGGAPRFDRERDAGAQATTGSGRHYDVGHEPARGQIFDDLAARRALAGND